MTMLTRLFYSVMVLSMAVFLWGCTPVSDSGESGNKGDLLVVFLVRHAEKVDQSMDPDLSDDGYLRAAKFPEYTPPMTICPRE